MFLLEVLLKFLGISRDDSPVNKTVGIGGYALIASAGAWAWAHWDEQLSVSATVGAWFMFGAVIWVFLEIARRSKT